MRGPSMALLVLVLTPAAAFAQEVNTVQEILGFLVTNHGVQTSDFDSDREAAAATRDTLTRALLSTLTQLPISTSSNSFTYRLNPALGTVERASETFGPFFVERTLTSGEGQASFGVTFQYASYGALDGYDLRDGQFVTVANRFRDEPAPFDIETLTLNISTRTTTVFGSLGVTEWMDVGAAVPLVSLNISGSRVNTYRGQSLLQASARGSTIGFADVALRTKVRLTGEGPASAAAAVEVRLPTGREEDLLGAGELGLRFIGIGSADLGSTSFHGNMTIGTGGLGREWSGSGALAHAATPRLTIVGELMARRMAGAYRVTEVIEAHPRISGVETLRLLPSGPPQTSFVAVGGFKWNVTGMWLLHGNVLLPIGNRGLTARITPTIALDYSFTQ